MRTALITAAGILTIVAIIPYLVEILRGKTKPRLVSWFTWTVLTAIATAASLSDGQIGSAVLTGSAGLCTLAVTVLGFRYGDRRFEGLDVVCQAAVLVGLLLWWLLDSPAAAVLAMIVIDLIGAIPTLKHSWQKPHEETWITFALDAVGGGLLLLTVTDWRVTAAAFPAYILLVNAATAALVVFSPHRHVSRAPAELREL